MFKAKTILFSDQLGFHLNLYANLDYSSYFYEDSHFCLFNY